MSEAPFHHHIPSSEYVRDLGTLGLRSERDGDVHVVALRGELDLCSAPAVEQELRSVEAGDADAILLDLSELEFIDSTGVRLLIMAEQRSRWDSGRLVLKRPPAPVFRAIEISGVAGILPFAD